jgi:hypothetical protein
VIDCDVHVQWRDPDDVLEYVDPAQRAWIAVNPLYGLAVLFLKYPVLLVKEI